MANQLQLQLILPADGAPASAALAARARCMGLATALAGNASRCRLKWAEWGASAAFPLAAGGCSWATPTAPSAEWTYGPVLAESTEPPEPLAVAAPESPPPPLPSRTDSWLLSPLTAEDMPRATLEDRATTVAKRL